MCARERGKSRARARSILARIAYYTHWLYYHHLYTLLLDDEAHIIHAQTRSWNKAHFTSYHYRFKDSPYDWTATLAGLSGTTRTRTTRCAASGSSGVDSYEMGTQRTKSRRIHNGVRAASVRSRASVRCSMGIYVCDFQPVRRCQIVVMRAGAFAADAFFCFFF